MIHTNNRLVIIILIGSLLLFGCKEQVNIVQTSQVKDDDRTGALNNTPRIEPTDQLQIVETFNAERALEDITYQLSLGARVPGSNAHQAVRQWIETELIQAGWDVEIQSSEINGHQIYNLIGRYGSGDPSVIIGAHYDSRFYADRDPDPGKRLTPTPGANDGASGVAVLLELARVIPSQMELTQNGRARQIWLVFFDAEDNGRIPGWDWILGSQAFVDQLTEYPDAAVIVDMVGDRRLNIYQEGYSDPVLSAEIWDKAAKLGYSQEFIAVPNHTILDDHVPFRNAGIPAVDIIDIDYPYWHTSSDTLDKVSGESLKIVGDTLLKWLQDGSVYFKQ